MSPLESATVLPCSEESSSARLSNSFCTRSKNLNSTRARRCGLVAAHSGCAAAALAIACSTSALDANASFACTSPVLGLNTSPARPEAPLTSLPPMKWPMSRMQTSSNLLFLKCHLAQPAASGKRRLVGWAKARGTPRPIYAASRARRAHADRVDSVGTAECAPCHRASASAAFAHPTGLRLRGKKSPALNPLRLFNSGPLGSKRRVRPGDGRAAALWVGVISWILQPASDSLPEPWCSPPSS